MSTFRCNAILGDWIRRHLLHFVVITFWPRSDPNWHWRHWELLLHFFWLLICQLKRISQKAAHQCTSCCTSNCQQLNRFNLAVAVVDLAKSDFARLRVEPTLSSTSDTCCCSSFQHTLSAAVGGDQAEKRRGREVTWQEDNLVPLLTSLSALFLPFPFLSLFVEPTCLLTAYCFLGRCCVLRCTLR